jgi:predicted kinase
MALTLTYTLGLPASGKTSWAKRQLQTDANLVLVSRDELRNMLHDGKFSKGNEKQVIRIQDQIISDALGAHRSVIVHDTNFHPSNVERFQGHADALKVELRERSFISVPLETCIERDLHRPESVGEHVIRRMWQTYLAPQPEPAPQHDAQLLDAIIVDMDGTLAIMGDRSPYDMSGLCINDQVNEPVARVLRREHGNFYPPNILVCSGRHEANRSATEQWLRRHEIPFTELWMRPDDDNRKDAILKREIYDEHIRGRYNVLYVLDDRDQVVELWRSLGLSCWQVAPGAF